MRESVLCLTRRIKMLNINARLAFKIIHEFGVLVLGEMRKGNGGRDEFKWTIR